MQLLAAAFLFSTGGAAIKGCALTSWQVACFRSGIAAVALLILLPEARRGWRARTWLIGVSYAATLVLFVLATKLTTSANAIFLQSTAPLYLLILGPLILKEPIRRVDVAVIVTVATGAILLLFGSQRLAATAPDPLRGNLLGACTGVTWAVTLTGLRWLGKRSTTAEPASTVVAAGNVIACVACLPMALPLTHVTFRDAAVLGYLGVFQIGFAYVLLVRSIENVPGFEAATLLLLEPVLNPIWTLLIYKERPSASALTGGVLILAATLGRTWWQARTAQSGLITPAET